MWEESLSVCQMLVQTTYLTRRLHKNLARKVNLECLFDNTVPALICCVTVKEGMPLIMFLSGLKERWISSVKNCCQSTSEPSQRNAVVTRDSRY